MFVCVCKCVFVCACVALIALLSSSISVSVCLSLILALSVILQRMFQLMRKTKKTRRRQSGKPSKRAYELRNPYSNRVCVVRSVPWLKRHHHLLPPLLLRHRQRPLFQKEVLLLRLLVLRLLDRQVCAGCAVCVGDVWPLAARLDIRKLSMCLFTRCSNISHDPVTNFRRCPPWFSGFLIY